MTKIALLIGIDKYENCKPLKGCEVDAVRIADLLKKNHDNTPNFTCEVMHTGNTIVSEDRLISRLRYYFNKPADDLLIYFSGHGSRSPMNGFLTAQNSSKKSKGISMRDIMLMAAKRKSKHLTIVIDACYSGNIGINPYQREQVSIPVNTAILASSSAEEISEMKGNRSVFSYLIEEGLKGAAANDFGEINVASLYELANRNLTHLEQRPEFKSNLSSMPSLRLANPIVSADAVNKLLTFFPTLDSEYTYAIDKEIDVSQFFLQYDKAGWIMQTSLNKGINVWKLSLKGRPVWKYLIRNSQIYNL